MADSIGMTFGRITSAIEKEIPFIKQRVPELVDVYGFGSFFRSYCQIWCLRVVGHAAIWPFSVVSIPSLNVTPVMTLAR